MSTVTPHLKMEFPSVNELLSTLPELVSLWDDLGAGSIRSPSHDYGGKPYDYHSHHFHGGELPCNPSSCIAPQRSLPSRSEHIELSDNTSASNCHFTNHVRSSTVSVEYAHDFPRLIDWSYSNLESTVKWQGKHRHFSVHRFTSGVIQMEV